MNYYELQVKCDRRSDILWSADEMLPFPMKVDDGGKQFYKNLCQAVNEQLNINSSCFRLFWWG